MARELKKVEYEGKVWYSDERLSQLRDVGNPHDYRDLNLAELDYFKGMRPYSPNSYEIDCPRCYRPLKLETLGGQYAEVYRGSCENRHVWSILVTDYDDY